MEVVIDLDNAGIAQLRNYAQWERDNGGDRMHALDWAADEIERLHNQVAELEAGSEPVAWVDEEEGVLFANGKEDGDFRHGTKLYTTPPPVKVPDEAKPDDAPKNLGRNFHTDVWVMGWNACREAMLAAQENH